MGPQARDARAALIRGRRVRLTLNAAFAAEIPPRFSKTFSSRVSPRRASCRVSRAGPSGSLAFARSVSRDKDTPTFRAPPRARSSTSALLCSSASGSPVAVAAAEDPSRDAGLSLTTFAVRSRPSRARIPSYRNRHPAKCRVSPRSDAPNTRRPSLFVFLRLRREPRASRAARQSPFARGSSRASPSPSRRGVSRAFASEGNRRAREVSISSASALSRRRRRPPPPPPSASAATTCQVAPRARRGSTPSAARRGRRRDLPG